MAANSSATPRPTPRVIFIGVGGGSCSGKTTFSKHMLRILRQAGDGRSFILHQDDFAPKEEDLPWAWNGEERVRDWDTPHGSVSDSFPTHDPACPDGSSTSFVMDLVCICAQIDFDRMHETMRYIREHARLPAEFSSHDNLNVLPDVAIPDDLRDRCVQRLRAVFGSEDPSKAPSTPQEAPIVVLVDGFLTYYDPRVRSELDLRFFCRSSREVMKTRRAERSYHTAGECRFQSFPRKLVISMSFPGYLLR